MIEPAQATVAALQNKVGTSLSNVQNLLAPPERAGALLSAGAAAQSSSLLIGVKDVQQEMLDCLRGIKSILQGQLDLEEEAERRARDQAAELAKSGNQDDTSILGTPIGNPSDSGEEVGSSLAGLFGPALAAWAGAGGLAGITKGIGKRLLKGGAVFLLADLIGDELAKYVDSPELKSFLADDLSVILGLGAFAGLPGAMAGLAFTGLSGIFDFLSGETEKLSLIDVGSVAIAGGWLTKFGGPKVAKFLAARGLTSAATLVAGVTALPVIAATGAAIAIGVGAKFLADKNDEYQQKTLDSLNELTKKTDEELTRRFALAEESFLEQIGLGGIFGTEQSELGEAQTATAQAVENVRDGDGLSQQNVTDLVELADKTVNISDEDLKILLADQTKTKNLTKVISNLRTLAVQGQLGDDGKRILKNMLMFGDRLQSVALQIQQETGRSNFVTSGLIAGTAGFQGGDLLEKFGEAEIRQDNLISELNTLQGQIANAKLKQERGEDPGVSIFRLENQLKAKQRLLEENTQKMNSLRDNRNFTQNVGFTMDDLRKIFTEEELRVMITKSMTNTGAAAIQPAPVEAPVNQVVSGSGNTISTVNKTDASTTYTGPMNTNIDRSLEEKALAN